jgi:hypothetical protein
MKSNEIEQFKKKKKNYFDKSINIHKPYYVFMKFCGFGSNENTTIILYKNYSCDTFKRHLII